MKHKAQAIFDFLTTGIVEKCIEKYTDVVFNPTKDGPTFIKFEVTPVLVDSRHYFEFEFIDEAGSIKKILTKFTVNSHGGIYVKDEYLTEENIHHDVFIEALLQKFNLSEQFKTAISVKELSSFPPDCNPFQHDLISMGTEISGGWYALYHEHAGNRHDGTPHPEPETIVLINARTGRRFELDMSEANKANKV